MPASQALHAQGTLFKVGDGATPENFSTLAEVKSIDGQSLDSDQLDVTNHTSDSAFREYIQGLKEAGEVSFDVNYVPTDPDQDGTTGLLFLYKSGVKKNFQMVFPSTPAITFSFAGFVKSCQVAAPVDDVLMMSVTVKLTGEPTLA